MLRYRLMALVLALTCVFLDGCGQGPVTWRRLTLNHPISTDDVVFIVPGKTNIAAVTERLGAPNEMLFSQSGIMTRYYFTDGRYFKANYGWGLRFLIPFFTPDLDLGGGGIGSNVLQVTYDNHWLVRDHAFAFHSRSSEFFFWPFKD